MAEGHGHEAVAAMTAAAIQQVRPAGARYEGLLLTLATVCVIGVLVMYVHRHGLDDVHDPLADLG